MSEQELNEIIKSYVCGVSTAEIAEIYDISESEAEKLIAENAKLAEEIREYRKGIEA